MREIRESLARALPDPRSPHARRDPRLRRERPADLIVIDSSAVVAFLLERGRVRDGSRRCCGAEVRAPAAGAGLVECSIVLARKLGDAGPRARSTGSSTRAGSRWCPSPPAHARLARDAFLALRQDAATPPALNFGDCMSYAVATGRGAAAPVRGRRLRADGHRGRLTALRRRGRGPRPPASRRRAPSPARPRRRRGSGRWRRRARR